MKKTFTKCTFVAGSLSVAFLGALHAQELTDLVYIQTDEDLRITVGQANQDCASVNVDINHQKQCINSLTGLILHTISYPLPSDPADTVTNAVYGSTPVCQKSNIGPMLLSSGTEVKGALWYGPGIPENEGKPTDPEISRLAKATLKANIDCARLISEKLEETPEFQKAAQTLKQGTRILVNTISAFKLQE